MPNSSGLWLGPDIWVLTASLLCSVSISPRYLNLNNSLMASGCSSRSSTSKTTDLAHVILTAKSLVTPSPHSRFVAPMPELMPVTWRIAGSVSFLFSLHLEKVISKTFGECLARYRWFQLSSQRAREDLAFL